jgi:hypothetical protein
MDITILSRGRVKLYDLLIMSFNSRILEREWYILSIPPGFDPVVVVRTRRVIRLAGAVHRQYGLFLTEIHYHAHGRDQPCIKILAHHIGGHVQGEDISPSGIRAPVEI